MSTTSTSFVCGSDIPEDTPFSIESAEKGHALWRRHRRRSWNNDSTLTACSLCKYIWEVILCMLLTGNRRLSPDIWPKIPDQAEDTEEMIKTIWAEEVHCQQKASGTKT